MDRVLVYAGEMPQDTHVLLPQRYAEIALGMMMRAAFGTGTVIDGLTVAQQAGPDMTVQVGPGAILTQTVVDPNAVPFGSLPVDTTTNLVKIGVNTQPVNMSALMPPPVVGQSQNWLVQAQFLEQDVSPSVLLYYNAAAPTVPWNGPANAGATQNTIRTNTVQLQWKGGTAATTGQQNTPTPDAGWVGVAIVTVANGASSITNANITSYASAPYVPTKLPQQRKKLTANLSLYLSPFGSDSANSGLSAASPLATIQKAWDIVVSGYDLNGYQVTVNMANGTYSAGLNALGAPLGGLGGAAAVGFVGNLGAPASVIVSVANGSTFSAQAGAAFTVSGMTVSTGGNGSVLAVNQNGNIAIGASLVFASCGSNSTHMYATNASTIAAGAGYTISGGATNHWNIQGSSTISIQNQTITLTGTPSFTIFAAASLCAAMSVQNNTFVGSATGQRYLTASNGIINTNGNGPNYLPGNTAGSGSGYV